MVLKYTPGSWETIGGPGTALAVCAPDGGDIIAEIHTGNVADRDLIAAATDTLEALENLMETIWDNVTGGDDDGEEHVELELIASAMLKANGIITEARGV